MKNYTKIELERLIEIEKFRDADSQLFDLSAMRAAELTAAGEDASHAMWDAFFGGDADSSPAVAEGNATPDSEMMALARAENAKLKVRVQCQYTNLEFAALTRRSKNHPAISAMLSDARDIRGGYAATIAALDAGKERGFTTVAEFSALVAEKLAEAKTARKRSATAQRELAAQRKERAAARAATNEMLREHGYVWKPIEIGSEEDWAPGGLGAGIGEVVGSEWQLYASDGRRISVSAAKAEIAERGTEIKAEAAEKEAARKAAYKKAADEKAIAREAASRAAYAKKQAARDAAYAKKQAAYEKKQNEVKIYNLNDSRTAIKSPYNSDFITALKAGVASARWNKSKRVWTFDRADTAQVRVIAQAHYPQFV